MNRWPIDPISSDPTVGTVSSYFGARPNPLNGNPETHKGIDIIAPVGHPVRAPEYGVILAVNETGVDPYGKFIVMITEGKFRLNFWHLNAVNCSKGDNIKAGEIIGFVGNTGATTGPHLHFQCCMANSPHAVALDPFNVYFDVYSALMQKRQTPAEYRAIKTELDNSKSHLDAALGFISNIRG